MPDTQSKFFFQTIPVRVLLPVMLTIILFVITIFFIMLPSFENYMMDRKREMIKNITQSAWSVLSHIQNQEKSALLSREEAQKKSH